MPSSKGGIRITRRYQTTAADCGVAPDMARKQGIANACKSGSGENFLGAVAAMEAGL